MVKILEVVSEHAAPIKTLFEVLKELLTDVTIKFMNDTEGGKNDRGIYINEMDSSKNAFAGVILKAENFSTFECKYKSFPISLNLHVFYKLIRSMNKDDIFALYVESESPNQLHLKIEDVKERKESEYMVKLIDMQENNFIIPAKDFDAIITMNSQEFNKLCREMSGIASCIEIQCLEDKVIFTCECEFAKRKTTFKRKNAINKSDDGVNDNDEPGVFIEHNYIPNNDGVHGVVQGIFELKYLVMFAKCTALCRDIEIHISNDFPLVINYTVASLGEIALAVAHMNQNRIGDSSYADNEEYYSDNE